MTRTFVAIPILILAAGLLVVAPQLQQAAAGIAESMDGLSLMQKEDYPDVASLADLPFSEHALTGHAYETWNAYTIAQYMSRNNCSPRRYACVNRDFYLYVCEVPDKPGMSMGLFVGRTVHKIITGFAARTSYFYDRCN